MSLIRRVINTIRSNGADPVRAPPPRGKVLVVDDDANLCELLRVAFTTRGYAVVTASDGRDGVEMAQRERPDAIVLDASMPVLDGFGALKELRRRGRTSEIPVVMLTARWQQGDVVAGLRYGAQEYLTKPVAVEEVIKTVEVLLQRHEPGTTCLLRMYRVGTPPDAKGSPEAGFSVMWTPTKRPKKRLIISMNDQIRELLEEHLQLSGGHQPARPMTLTCMLRDCRPSRRCT